MITISQGHSNCDHATHFQYASAERHSNFNAYPRSLSKSGNAATSNVLPKTRSHSSTLGPYPLMFDGSLELRLDRPVHIRITPLNFEWVFPCFDFLRHPLMKVLGLVLHCVMRSYDCAFPFHYATHLIVILLCLCHLRLYFVYKYSLYSPMLSLLSSSK